MSNLLLLNLKAIERLDSQFDLFAFHSHYLQVFFALCGYKKDIVTQRRKPNKEIMFHGSFENRFTGFTHLLYMYQYKYLPFIICMKYCWVVAALTPIVKLLYLF